MAGVHSANEAERLRVQTTLIEVKAKFEEALRLWREHEWPTIPPPNEKGTLPHEQ